MKDEKENNIYLDSFERFFYISLKLYNKIV